MNNTLTTLNHTLTTLNNTITTTNNTISCSNLPHPFFTTQNVNLLWNLIHNEYKLSNNSQSMQTYKQGITDIFNSNMKQFETKSITTEPLIIMNKTFLAQVNTAIRNIFPDIRQRLNNSEKIQILHQDIQEEKQRQFQQQVDEKQNEFNAAHAKPQPPEPIDMTDKTVENRDPQSFQEQLNRMKNERGYETPPSVNVHTDDYDDKNMDAPLVSQSTTNKSMKKVSWKSKDEENEKSQSSKNMLMLVLQNTGIILEQLQTIIELLKQQQQQQ